MGFRGQSRVRGLGFLTYRFYYYSGVAKPIDQDQGRTAIEKVVLLHSHIPRGGGVPPRGPHRGALGLVLRLKV